MANKKPMREVTKATPKEGSDGPPSSIKGDNKKNGPRQTQGNKPKVAEQDMMAQNLGMKDQPPDPFEYLMKQASRNSKYALPFETNGTADPGDPIAATGDEHENAPRRRRWS